MTTAGPDRNPRTALVTGATRGIGRATAIALARLGYDVAITGRTEKEGDAGRRPEAAVLTELTRVTGSLASTAAAIEAEGRRAVPLVLDLLDREALQPVAAAAIEALGHIDVLVNNAIYVGPAGELRFLDTPPEEIERRVFGNVSAQLILTQPVLRHMVARGRGTIANVTSAAGYLPPHAAAGDGGWALTYGVSKAGLHRIVAQLLAEHAGDGIVAYNLQPGAVATERVLAAGAKLEFVARMAAPVDAVGATIARIIDAPAGTFENGANIQVQDVAKEWGIL
jgi:NAD(P)-dependent dehydrogenase (short-subunit alcohol dehydrogenase family)